MEPISTYFFENVDKGRHNFERIKNNCYARKNNSNQNGISGRMSYPEHGLSSLPQQNKNVRVHVSPIYSVEGKMRRKSQEVRSRMNGFL